MWLTIVEVLVVTLACCAASVHYIHALQAGRYQLPAYRHWLSRNRDRILKDNVMWAFVAALLRMYLPVVLSMFIKEEGVRGTVSFWLVLLSFTGLMAWTAWRDYSAPSKKPFVVTRRVRRLMGVLFALCLLLTSLMAMMKPVAVAPYFLYALMPFMVLLAAVVIEPYENRLNAAFLKSARRKIREHKKLIVIGVSGSYGKTNVKNILREMLSGKYRVLATPASFNTALGISRVINEQLKPEHQVFIAEMGAAHIGDVRSLVELVRPKYGILTSVGPRRLDSFGSMENIASAQFELIQGLPKGGLAVFGTGDDYTDRLYSLCRHEKIRVGMDEDEGAYMRARGCVCTDRGTTFEMVCADGDTVQCRTALLGSFNIKNILLAAALAHRMGVDLEQIATAIKRLSPMDHHMQLVSGDVTMIDDTLNTDADSAFEAMRVIAQMPGRRIVVTPGLGEQEGKEAEVNYALGTVMADSADSVILVGRRAFSRSIVRGLIQSGFSRANLHMANDMEAASDILEEISEAGDVVLFESRIPDYEEEE